MLRCLASKCRGSFLYYANSATFTEVMGRTHTFLHRTANLVRAGPPPNIGIDTCITSFVLNPS